MYSVRILWMCIRLQKTFKLVPAKIYSLKIVLGCVVSSDIVGYTYNSTL